MQADLSTVKALLFDLDGTLIDSSADIAASANELRRLVNLAPLPLETVSSYIGDGIESLVRRVLGDSFEPQTPELVDHFRNYYHEHCVDATRLYEGVSATLSLLQQRGYRMAVVTNKPERISQRILELLKVSGYFSALIGGNTCERKKPDQQPLAEACRRMGVELRSSCMIGDSRVDVEAGKNAGMMTLALKGGIGDEQAMLQAGPYLVLQAFGELPLHFKGTQG